MADMEKKKKNSMNNPDSGTKRAWKITSPDLNRLK